MSDPTQAILVWPGVGIGAIAALVWGYKVIPGLYLAQLAIAFLFSSKSSEMFIDFHEFYISHLFILLDVFRCYFAAFLIKYIISYPNALISKSSIFKFFFIAAPIASFVSTFGNELLKYSFGFLRVLSLNKNNIDWWFGDLMGFIIFAPLTLILISQPRTIWKPRLITMGLPVIIILLFVVLIYNKSQSVDNSRAIENLEIKNSLIASKLEQHNYWLNELLTNIFTHFTLEENPERQLSSFFKSLELSNSGPSAITWILNDEVHYINSSSSNPNEKFEKFKAINLNSLISRFKKTPKNTPLYFQEIDSLINVYKFTKNNNEYTLLIFIAHDFLNEISILSNEYQIKSTYISLTIPNLENTIVLQSVKTKFPIKPITIESSFNFNDQKWILSIKPTARYLFYSKSNLSNIIAKIGLLFTGLIGIMLLIITGKTALTDTHVKERTFDLDIKAEQLKNNKKQYQDLIEQHPVILWRLNLNSKKINYISDKVIDLFGYSMDDWLSQEDFWIDHIHQDDQEDVRLTIKNSLRDNSAFELTYRFIKSNNKIAWIKDVININKDKKFEDQLVGLMVDETEAHAAKQNQLISESKYRILFKHAVDPLIIIDLEDNSFKDANDKAILLFGLNNISGHVTLADFSPIKQPDGGESQKGLRRLLRKLNKNKEIKFEWRMLDKTHQEIICNVEIVILPEQNRSLALVNINDITQNKQHQKKINQLAYYDNLTKLPNREYFYTKFEYFHGQAINKNQYGTIIYLDLDRFKILNDSLGHQAGDELLKMVANRIRLVSSKSEFCARLGGDEFIILNKKFESTVESALENCLVKAELILEALNEPYQLGDYEHYITPSIGISYFPFNDNTTDQIIHQADIAMYSSKAKGKNTITIYQDTMIKHVGKRLKIEKAIRQALTNNEFQMFYQTQVNEKNEIISVEALLRWEKSKELKINTEDLIETVEEIGLTHELGYWVFDQTCAQLENWQKQGHNISYVAINVSAKQFHQALFVDQIKSVIQSYNIHPSQIVIELTEAVIIEDMVSLIKKLSELKSYGVKISLDDFGTGYSSLAYLKHLPIDQLKIDKLFIHDLSHDKTSQHIVKTIIDLANSMDIELIAEGIEMKEQFDILKSLGCKNFQGFYFAIPSPAEDIFKNSSK